MTTNDLLRWWLRAMRDPRVDFPIAETEDYLMRSEGEPEAYYRELAARLAERAPA